MDQDDYKEKLNDAVNSILEKGFYEEDLGPFTVLIDYRETEKEADE